MQYPTLERCGHRSQRQESPCKALRVAQDSMCTADEGYLHAQAVASFVEVFQICIMLLNEPEKSLLPSRGKKCHSTVNERSQYFKYV